jgi:tight adherence protein B
MVSSSLAVIFLAAIAAGGVAYVFIYPLLSGEKRAEKRKEALVSTIPERKIDRGLSAASRRDQVAQSLKEIEKREAGKNKLTLDAKIAQAGLSLTRQKFYLLSVACGLCLALMTLIVSGALIPAAAMGFVGVFGLPQWALGYLKKRRINKFVAELPNAMDIIVRGIRAGLPLGDCVREIANSTSEPLRGEFRLVVEAQTVGIPLSEALQKTYERVPVPEANFLATVITIQSKAGGNLSEAIGNLSRVLRERKKIKGKIAAMSMEAKASGAIIASLPFIVGFMTYLSSPDYISILWTTQVGKIVLGISAVWMTIGVSVMKKMINFDL